MVPSALIIRFVSSEEKLPWVMTLYPMLTSECFPSDYCNLCIIVVHDSIYLICAMFHYITSTNYPIHEEDTCEDLRLNKQMHWA